MQIINFAYSTCTIETRQKYSTKQENRNMRVLIQRVKRASVTIEETLKSQIGEGMLILVGIEEEDTDEDINWLVK